MIQRLDFWKKLLTKLQQKLHSVLFFWSVVSNLNTTLLSLLRHTPVGYFFTKRKILQHWIWCDKSGTCIFFYADSEVYCLNARTGLSECMALYPLVYHSLLLYKDKSSTEEEWVMKPQRTRDMENSGSKNQWVCKRAGGSVVIEERRGYGGSVRNINRSLGLPARAHSAPNTYCHSD